MNSLNEVLEDLEDKVDKLVEENLELKEDIKHLASMVKELLNRAQVDDGDFIVDYEETSEYWDYQRIMEICKD